MEIQFTLDEVKERYVRSMESKLELYREGLMLMAAIGLLIGFVVGMATGVWVVRRAVAAPVGTKTETVSTTVRLVP